MATPQYPPPPQPPPPPAGKKTSPLVWILGGCLGIIVLGCIIFAIGTYMVARKVKEVAGGNPASVVRMIASMNPDVEVVSSDDKNGKITIRNKKDGKVVTLNFEDIKNGKFSFEDGEGAKVQIGSGGKAPAWVPAYPGSSPQGSFSSNTDKETTGSYSFTTKDSLERVSKYYQDALKTSGFAVETMSAGTSGVVAGKTADDQRTVSVNIGGDGSETTVAVTYNEKK